MKAKRVLSVELIGLEISSLPKPLSWLEIFGNSHPVELEIGVGKGGFMVPQAKARPEVNFFGIEWARALWRYSSDRLRRNRCFNTRMLRTEGGQFLAEYVPDNSLSAIHVYFPDPWPKRRHHKRRLVQGKFLREAERALSKGGQFRFVTDHKHYFEQVEALIAKSRLRAVPFESWGGVEVKGSVGSNFEKIFDRQGIPHFCLAAVR